MTTSELLPVAIDYDSKSPWSHQKEPKQLREPWPPFALGSQKGHWNRGTLPAKAHRGAESFSTSWRLFLIGTLEIVVLPAQSNMLADAKDGTGPHL